MFEEFENELIANLGVPPALLSGDGNYSSSVASSACAMKAFEEHLRAVKVGLQFTLEMLLDPMIQEGHKALAEYREHVRRQKATAHERN